MAIYVCLACHRHCDDDYKTACRCGICQKMICDECARVEEVDGDIREYCGSCFEDLEAAREEAEVRS